MVKIQGLSGLQKICPYTLLLSLLPSSEIPCSWYRLDKMLCTQYQHYCLPCPLVLSQIYQWNEWYNQQLLVDPTSKAQVPLCRSGSPDLYDLKNRGHRHGRLMKSWQNRTNILEARSDREASTIVWSGRTLSCWSWLQPRSGIRSGQAWRGRMKWYYLF